MGITRFPRGVSSFGMPVIGSGGHMTTGNVFFVQYTNGSDGNEGTSPDAPFKTLDAAIGKCTASQGDTIFVMEGHAETPATAIQVDVAGITIIGIGNGDNRPTLTLNATIPLINIVADDVKIYNLSIKSSTSAGAASRMIRVAASDIEVIGCRLEHVGTTYKIYHCVVVKSGDNIKFVDCEFINSATTNTATHPQTALLNITGTGVLVKGCRFLDQVPLATERWRACVEGGALASTLIVEDCTFVCRGIATRTRTAGSSATTLASVMGTLYCRAISPSAGTAAGAVWTASYQYIIESYSVAAVNKHALIGVSSSDLRLKTGVMYL